MRSRRSAPLPTPYQSVSTTDSNLALFAWNGIAFQTPKRWELSVNELVKGVSRIVLEDDFGPRLELDWTTPRSPSETERFRKRSLEYIKIIDEKSRSVTPLAALPDEWTAHLYRMTDDSFLATAYMVPPSSDAPFVFFRIHFTKGTPELPETCCRRHGHSMTSISRLTAVSASRAHPCWPVKNFSPSNGGFAAFSYGIFLWRIILQETPRPPNGARIF